jgi:hypothetical protein
LEVCSLELKLWEVDVARNAPGLESELLTTVHELGGGAGGFNLSLETTGKELSTEED